jgi:hydrogenase maturation factor HypE
MHTEFINKNKLHKQHIHVVSMHIAQSLKPLEEKEVLYFLHVHNSCENKYLIMGPGPKENWVKGESISVNLQAGEMGVGSRGDGSFAADAWTP